MLNFTIARLYSLGRLKSYFSVLNWKQAAKLAALNLRKKSESLQIEISGIELLIRSCTPDYDVAKDALVYGEYDVIELENPSVILDLGANIGTSAIALSRQFPNATVYAIEMEKTNFDILSKNVAPFENIVPIHAAVAASCGIREIFDRSTGPWGYTIAGTPNETTELGEKVEALSIDALSERLQISKIDLLKIDIEGTEKEIFENAGRWLTMTDTIIVELHDYIVIGASRAFYMATVDFSRFELHGEKILAYR